MSFRSRPAPSPPHVFHTLIDQLGGVAPSLVSRLQARTNVDLRRVSDRPALARIVMAGVISLVASLVADAFLVAVGRGLFHRSGGFGPFHASAYVPLTVLGVVGATVGWAVLLQVTSRPRWVLLRAAIVVTVVLLVPDVNLLPTNPGGPVATLMVMHLAIAVVTYAALRGMAPARGTPVPGRFLPTWQAELAR